MRFSFKGVGWNTYPLGWESVFQPVCLSSICTVGLPLSSGMVVFISLVLNIFQSILLYTNLGVLGFWIGFVLITAFMGRWLLARAFHGSSCIFRWPCLFSVTRFGDVALLSVVYVGKSGSSNAILPLLIRLAKVKLTALFFSCPRMQCLALKPPRVNTGLLYQRRLDRSPYDMYGLLGGKSKCLVLQVLLLSLFQLLGIHQNRLWLCVLCCFWCLVHGAHVYLNTFRWFSAVKVGRYLFTGLHFFSAVSMRVY